MRGKFFGQHRSIIFQVEKWQVWVSHRFLSYLQPKFHGIASHTQSRLSTARLRLIKAAEEKGVNEKIPSETDDNCQ